jgi:hypothetical protein
MKRLVSVNIIARASHGMCARFAGMSSEIYVLDPSAYFGALRCLPTDMRLFAGQEGRGRWRIRRTSGLQYLQYNRKQRSCLRDYYKKHRQTHALQECVSIFLQRIIYLARIRRRAGITQHHHRLGVYSVLFSDVRSTPRKSGIVSSNFFWY